MRSRFNWGELIFKQISDATKLKLDVESAEIQENYLSLFRKIYRGNHRRIKIFPNGHTQEGTYTVQKININPNGFTRVVISRIVHPDEINSQLLQMFLPKKAHDELLRGEPERPAPIPGPGTTEEMAAEALRREFDGPGAPERIVPFVEWTTNATGTFTPPPTTADQAYQLFVDNHPENPGGNRTPAVITSVTLREEGFDREVENEGQELG